MSLLTSVRSLRRTPYLKDTVKGRQRQLGTNPSLEGQRQTVFVSSNDADASAAVAAVATQLGFAPVELGRRDKGGVPLHVVRGQPGGLLFQNLVKLG
jgi:hypothetical protein